MDPSTALRLAVALDGAPGAGRPGEGPVPPEVWAERAAEAERGRLDLLTLDDAHAPAPDGRARPEAVQLAALLGALTGSIGIVPTVTPTHGEPFHLSTAIATLDFVTGGRAGCLVRAGLDPAEDRNTGRTATGTDRQEDRQAETAEAVEVIRALWDTWEDGAEIRDAARGLFLDRERVRPAGHRGRYFAVRGPSITPRPPQGQPPVLVAVRDAATRGLAVRAADLALLTAADPDDAREQAALLRAAEAAAGRPGPPLLLFADLTVALDDDPRRARARRPSALEAPDAPDAPGTFAGTPAALVTALTAWRAAGLDGVRLLPASPERDLPAITRGLVPELRARGARHDRPDSGTLRERLGLPRPANRLAAPTPADHASGPR
ncbi:LLM class flavin-dependent oxidoreductase [Kitasatospora sp. NPDC004240]